jgi:L-threonylcarbamoyladenylate synthase
MAAGDLDDAVAAVRAGQLVLVPTDGVYGLCASPLTEAPIGRLYALKGRGADRPAAILAASLAALRQCLPDLSARDERLVRALVPGPYTLVVANPGRRFPWLSGAHPETIGVRVAVLPAQSQALLDAVSVLAATSANLPGGPDPGRLDEVPEAIRSGCAAELDAGDLPGRPSTVIDLTGQEPRVLREGAGPVPEALARLAEAARVPAP